MDKAISAKRTQKRSIISGKFDEYYESESLNSMTPSDSFNLRASTIQDIYALYDDLVAHDRSITRHLLGYGTDKSGQEDHSLPIYEYVLAPPETSQKTHGNGFVTDLHPAPTLLITTGVHGHEKSTVYAGVEFAKQLSQNPQNSRGLADLKSNFVIKIIPIVNPGGYNRDIRNTLTEVDINRNFSYKWVELDHACKGTAPYSQRETQILKEWLSLNRGAFAYLDFHNFTRIGESIGMPERKREMTSYHLSPNEDLDSMYSSLIRRLSHSWKDSYLSCFSELGNVAYGFIYSDKGQEIPSTISEAYYQYGIKLAAIPEITYNDPLHPELLYTQTVMELSVEFFINYILTLVDCFKN